MPRTFDPNEPELMDRPQPVSAELEKDLANLASLNRWFGSHRQLRRFLRRWWKSGDAPTVLDLCTGAGDLPAVMCRWAHRHEVRPRITAVDANPATLEIARRRCTGLDRIEFVQADALHALEGPDALTPIPDASGFAPPGARFDLVHCSLALHHFSEPDAIRLLRGCLARGRRVLVSDLVRGWSTSLGVWLLTALFYREPMTKYDGRVSARRAFSFSEFRRLAEQAGWENFHHSRFLFCRQAMWMEADVS
jgi:SAM-dependent methyltransferase